ncbi:adenyl-nucleotide exchange factor sse1 [Globomyces sp. JEL0801]|nr:adenyl-nucleotide exchange factor sse1 [Globomyces sp. JEL0801]
MHSPGITDFAHLLFFRFTDFAFLVKISSLIYVSTALLLGVLTLAYYYFYSKRLSLNKKPNQKKTPLLHQDQNLNNLQMSVVGIDFGSLNTVVAVARNRGIDVITNETSNRATPSLVSFGEKQRFLGEGAKTLEISNFKNTVASLKRLSGRKFNDPEVQSNEKTFVNAKVIETSRGECGVSVNFKNEQEEFSYTQLSAMFLTKVKDFTSAELGIPVSDCVISCPVWFTDAQRRAILDASHVAGLNCLRLLNDTTACALGYGITKTDLPDVAADEKLKPRIVTFVDVGHSSCQVTVVSFVKGKLTILGTAYDRNLGGRDFDQVITEHFIKEFNAKYKLKIHENAKATFRLRAGAERVKKILSANSTAPFNIECLLDDKDVSAMVKREDFEEMCVEFMKRFTKPVTDALAAAKVTTDDVDFVELVGGSTRIPMIKEHLCKIFGGTVDGPNKLAFTLNQDEAVARGCAFQCAIMSPVFKVRDFTVQDINTHPIELHWESAQMPDPKKGEKNVTYMEAFGPNISIPSLKAVTLSRALRNKELGKANSVSMNISAVYGDEKKLPTGTSTLIGSWVMDGIQRLPVKEGEKDNQLKANIKIKARLDGNGLVNVESAEQLEEVIVPIEESKDSNKPADELVDTKTKTKKIIKKHPLTVTGTTASATPELLADWLQSEGNMSASDRLVIDTAERRNALEEYVYETRSKLSDQWNEFVVEAEREKFTEVLNNTEDWLYGEGEDVSKSVYIEKLVELRKTGDPIASRFIQSEERPYAEKEFREAINGIILDVQADDGRYEHIAKEELDELVSNAQKRVEWLNEQVAKQNDLPKSSVPILTAEKIRAEQTSLKTAAHKVLSKPKPKPAPKEEPKVEKETAAEDVPMEDAPPLEEVPGDEIAEEEAPKEGLSMDLD